MRTPVQVPDLIRETSSWWSSERAHIYMNSFIASRGSAGAFTPDATPEAVGDWYAHTTRGATPYWISADMAELAWHAHLTFPAGPLHEADLASPDGFAYFAQPLTVLDIDNEPVRLRAVHWSSGIARNYYQPGSVDQGVEVVVYTGTNDQHPDYFKDLPGDPRGRKYTLEEAERGIGELIPFLMLFWPYGKGAETELTIDKWGNRHWAGEVDRERTTHEQWNSRTFLMTMWTLMQQRVAVTRRAPVDRHARKRGERAGLAHPHEVNVITLRRELQPLEASEHAIEHRRVDWKHRWMVGGHWRLQPYGDGVVRRIWIAPYVKGPENKPLRFTKDVYQWVR